MEDPLKESGPLARIGRAIRSFLDCPATNLIKGILLLLIGLSEASHTLKEDIRDGRLRVGHGLVIIGIFGILDSVPRFLEGLEASSRFLEHRRARRSPPSPADRPGSQEAEPKSGGTQAPD